MSQLGAGSPSKNAGGNGGQVSQLGAGRPSNPGAAAKTELADTSRKPAIRILLKTVFIVLLWGCQGVTWHPQVCVFDCYPQQNNALLRFSEFEKTLFQNGTVALERSSHVQYIKGQSEKPLIVTQVSDS